MDEQLIGKSIYHPGGPLTDQNQLLGRTSLYKEDGTPLDISTLADSVEFPVSRYGNVQEAIDAAFAAGGGVVTLPSGVTEIGASKIQMKSKVWLRGPENTWSVTGYDTSANAKAANVAWLNAAAGTDPVIEFGTDVTNAGISNILIAGNNTNRVGINVVAGARGGNRIEMVMVVQCGSVANAAVYLGQPDRRSRPRDASPVDLGIHPNGDGRPSVLSGSIF